MKKMLNGQSCVVGGSSHVALDDLTAELLTGNSVIDADHQQFFDILKATRSVCQDMAAHRDCTACSAERRAHCENHLLGLLGDLLSFVSEHFKTEESMMRDSLLVMVDRLACVAHIEEHAAISSKIEHIISASDTAHTVTLLRDLDSLLVGVTEHIASRDVALLRWIEREDSALQSGF